MIVLSLWKGEIGAEQARSNNTMRDIAAHVASRHGLTLKEIRSDSRERRITWPRQEAMYEIRRCTNKSFPAIGRFFDCDHTTVMYGCAAHLTRQGAV